MNAFVNRDIATKRVSLSLQKVRYIPSLRLGVLFVAISFVFVLAPFFSYMVLLGLGLDIVLVAFAFFDAFLLSTIKPQEINRVVPSNIEVMQKQRIQIDLRMPKRVDATFIWADSPPQNFLNNTPIEGSFRLREESSFSIEYELTPTSRGNFAFGSFYMKTLHFFGLVAMYSVWSAENNVRVYPPLPTDIGRFGLARRLAGMRGAHPIFNVKGSSGEFESLRRYQHGDDIRLIDWKATARRSEMIVRQNTFEKDQALIVCIDTGRAMIGSNLGVARIEWAMKAAMTLASEAIDAGDRVGIATIGAGLESFLPARQGIDQLRRIREHLVDVQVSYTESDFETAALELKKLVPKRSLMIIISDFADSSSIDYASGGIRLLSINHMVIFAFLRDEYVFDIVKELPTDDLSAVRQIFASNLIKERLFAIKKIKSNGAFVIDSTASMLTLSLLKQYLYVKSRGLL